MESREFRLYDDKYLIFDSRQEQGIIRVLHLIVLFHENIELFGSEVYGESLIGYSMLLKQACIYINFGGEVTIRCSGCLRQALVDGNTSRFERRLLDFVRYHGPKNLNCIRYNGE